MKQTEEHNFTHLANGVELGERIIRKIAGEEISNHVGGEQLNATMLKSALCAKIQGVLITSEKRG